MVISRLQQELECYVDDCITLQAFAAEYARTARALVHNNPKMAINYQRIAAGCYSNARHLQEKITLCETPTNPLTA